MAIHEYEAGQLQDLDDGELRASKLGPVDVLLARDGDRVCAVGAKCTHYGAPLADGLLIDGIVHCPWHKASFRASDGAVTAPPALDSLPSFPVRIDGGTIYVSVPDDAPDQVTPAQQPGLPDTDGRMFVIVGAGAAGSYAAQRLRLEGFRGRLVMISDDDHLPYDRTKLSKPFLAGKQSEDQLPLRPEAFYAEHAIKRLIASVRGIDVATRTVTFDGDHEPITADALLIATGSAAKRLDVLGADLGNVFTLRREADAERIIAAAGNASRGVVIGDGFTGMEAAASLTQRGLDVTLLSRSGAPLTKTLGDQVAGVLAALHTRNGVTIRQGEAAAFEGDDRAERVRLADGGDIAGGLFVYGIGATPLTGFVHGADRQDDGGIPVNASLKVADGVWVAGEIAALPENDGHRVEHWRMSQQLGWTAAEQMLGRDARADMVPFFWTNQFGMRVDIAGQPSGHADITIDGTTEGDQPTFLATYYRDGSLIGAAAVKRDKAMNALLARWQKARTLSASDVEAIASAFS